MKLLAILIVLVTLLPTLVTAGGRGYEGSGRQAYTSVYQKQNIEHKQQQQQTANGGRGYGGESNQSQTASGGRGGQGGDGGRGGSSDQSQTAKATNKGNNNYTSYQGDDYDDMYSDYVASAISPALVAHDCFGSVSAGVQIPGWAGLSGGSTNIDPGCNARADSGHLAALSERAPDYGRRMRLFDASIKRLCSQPDMAAVLEVDCPPSRIKPEPVQSSMFELYE